LVPRIKYATIALKPLTRQMIAQANTIIAEYTAKGFDLTLRQLYYQFVSRDLFPPEWADPATGSTNNEKSYDKLGNVITNGRMCGLIDWDAITDRMRVVKQNNHWDSPASIISACASQYKIDKWARQPRHVEVFIEKDALVGVIENVCKELDVPCFACRGYASVSALWEAGHGRMREAMKAPHKEQLSVIYLGDHDPSGLDMDRDVKDRLKVFVGHLNHVVSEIEVVRLALTRAQITQYNPPPNPTKATDSRAAKYIEEHGTTCWELDALDPQAIVELVREAVIERRDEDLWDEAIAEEEEQKEQLTQCAERWDDVTAWLVDS
jgi:hypothetical protein